MRTPTEIEGLLLRAQQELLDCTALTVDQSITGELSEIFESTPVIFSYLPEFEDVVFSRDLCVRSARLTELRSCWHTSPSVGVPELRGEFRITDLFTAARKRSPNLAWTGSSDEEREFYTEWRVVDDTPLTAEGQLAAVRIQKHKDPWEVWFYDMNLYNPEGWAKQYVKLDLTYPEYLEQLAVTKGTLGWQYLFTSEVALTNPDLKDVKDRLTAMLEIFPQLFPAWNYDNLKSRLDARV